MAALASAAALPALAQYTGPSVGGASSTVAAALEARAGSYVTLEGLIVAHLREDCCRSSDGEDEIRVEIPPAAFAGRPVGPDTRVRPIGEVDPGVGGPCVWVTSPTLL